MARISRSTHVKAGRIHANYVNRMTNVANVDYVEKVGRMEETKTVKNQSSENYLLSYEHYYRTIQELKKEFKSLYHHEQELYEALTQLDENDKQLMKQTNSLVEKYNQALLALRQFDALAGTEHVVSIHHVFTSFSDDFAKIGITENSDFTLALDANRFLSFMKSDQSAAELISRFKSMVLKEYQSFMRAKGQKKPLDAYEAQPLAVKGLIIEEEL